MMRVYHDEDADASVLVGKRIAVIGYGNQGRSQALNLLVGFTVAFLAGYVAIGFLLGHLRSRTLRPFALYCWGFGLFSLVVTFIR